MDQVTRNVLRHVYEALLSRPRMADSGNISNLQLFYNRLISEHCASDKKGQLLVVPLTGQDVDDFYSRKMKREQFVEVIRSKVIAKVAHFDSSVLYKLCWECFSSSHDAELTSALTMISPFSATLLWLLFCKLDNDGKLKLHPEDVTELLVRLLIHLRVTPDRKTVETWLGDHMGSLAAWISFWPFFIVTVQKCLGPRGAQATSRAVQALHEEVVDEVMKKAQMIKKGHLRHTWKMRWFVLTSTDLIYYETKESLVKKGSVVLNSRARVEVMMDKNEKDTRYPNRFKVVDGISNQFTEISAETLAQMNEWVEAINMAIKLNLVDGRNYIHKLQLVQKNPDTCESPHSLVKQTFSAQLSGQPSSNGLSDTNGHNKINRKISLPVFNTNPSPAVDGREAMSANSSQADLYSVVDKKKKTSVPTPTNPPSTRRFPRHDYEEIDDESLPQPPAHYHTDSKPNGPPRIPAPYHGNNTELNPSSLKKMANMHSNSVDMHMSTSVPGTRGDEAIMRQTKLSSSVDNPSQKRHSSIIDEDDFNRTYSTIQGERPNIRRSHTPDITSIHSSSVDRMSSNGAPEVLAYLKPLPPAIPKRGSPISQRKQLAVDAPQPPLPPKKQPPVEYSEVPANLATTLGMPNGIAGLIIHEDKNSSYADLDFSQLPAPTANSSEPPVDHSKRDYADIDFATTQKLEKNILKDENATTSVVKLPPKVPSKNTGSVEDKSGYVKVDLSGRSNGQPRQMMVLQPQQSTGRVSPSPMRTVSVETPPSRPIPTPRGQTSAPSIPPHHSKNPPPLPPKQTPY